ncbi:Uncharacterised protein [Helicobacter fennelliae]|uniref:Uncharacterized protein n=1 Tax=Helicobacter fennelliae TaxID=215 RepID=A0A2X3EMY8_9HELI|nr:hypothetical protein [Helicobacter fennelliae]SQC36377.1 Uncharacterised protein [Helicobacter fennelliae]
MGVAFGFIKKAKNLINLWTFQLHKMKSILILTSQIQSILKKMNSYTNIINTQQEDKGTQFFRLYENKDALYPLNQSNTTAYTLHTGNEYGDYKGIDLAKDKDNELTQNRKDSTNQSHTQSSQGFFHTLESLKQKYKDILESLKDDRGRIMIKVEVGYELYEFAKYFTLMR